VGRKKARLTDVRIEPLRRQIERWRRTRTKRSPMPASLWHRAVALAREHGVYAAAQELRLSYDSLRTRTEAAERVPARGKEGGLARATFVELGAGAIAPAPVPAALSVEITGSNGQRLTVRLHGGELDVAELIRACWSGRT
jgi:hypothetical protein